ncbi:MAG: hypothetical protein GX971_12535 [Firmicutes bacterium]|jgi:YbbR domain-containing protein|nr:hypothetical protein [Bacillota bacterium]
MSPLKKLWTLLTKPEVYWRLFSLALAIMFWLLAAGDGTLGETERTLTLPVEVQNLPDDLVLVDAPEAVKVRIRGLSPLLNRGESAIFASIDLTGAQEGTETYNVEVEGPLGIDIVGVTPSWVSIYTEELAESVFPVTLAFLGIERAGMVADLRPQPAVITIKGARSTLEQVDHVVAYLNIDQNSRIGDSFPVRALDAQGRSIPALTIEPAEITVVLAEKEPEPSGEE